MVTLTMSEHTQSGLRSETKVINVVDNVRFVYFVCIEAFRMATDCQSKLTEASI